MLPSAIEWDNADDSVHQNRRFTSSTGSFSLPVSLFPDEIDDSKKYPLINAQAPMIKPMKSVGRPPVTESNWNVGVEELVEIGHSNLSTKSMRRLMDQDLVPRSRTEAFQCLRRLDKWSDELESKNSQKDATVDKQKRRHSNSSLVRMKGSQIRRRLFSRDRESSFEIR